MRMFILMFLFIVKLAFAAEIPLHQQQIENAIIDQNALDVSAKKVHDHKEIEIQEKFVIPEFHKQAVLTVFTSIIITRTIILTALILPTNGYYIRRFLPIR